MFKIPEDLLGMPERHQSIELEGCTVIESCHHETLVADSVYVNQRVLLCILSGSIAIDFEEGTSTIEEGQIGLLNKCLRSLPKIRNSRARIRQRAILSGRRFCTPIRPKAKSEK